MGVRFGTSAEAKDMVLLWHYSRKMPSTPIWCVVQDCPKAAAVFSMPASPFVRVSPLGPEYAGSVYELGRLVMEPGHGRNELSRFLAAAIRLLPQGTAIVSYADTEQGHTGAIYKATNWLYCGVSKGRRDRDPGGGKHSRHVNTSMPFKYRHPKHRFLFLHGDRRWRKSALKMLRWIVET